MARYPEGRGDGGGEDEKGDTAIASAHSSFLNFVSTWIRSLIPRGAIAITNLNLFVGIDGLPAALRGKRVWNTGLMSGWEGFC